MIEVLVKAPQVGDQLLDLSLDLFDVAAQRLPTGVDPVQQPRAGVRAHMSHQAGVEGPVSQRVITSIIAQYTCTTRRLRSIS
ncbi:hypothetical protein [Nonomuraea fuscirosea]|uniref:hypothetical protein n=1 Tax=Nonomuraea fuscirosea TaxID=1291556 RepID=UPI003F4DC54B